MKTTTKPFRGIEAANASGKVLHFPDSAISPDAQNVASRQRAVRDALTGLTRTGNPAAPVAYALAIVLPDGTIEFSTQGIERDFAIPLADSLDRLSAILRNHGSSPSRGRRNQRGIAKLAPLVAIGFMAATYLNDLAWLDSLLMIAGQLSVNWLLRRGSPTG
jgi:hypothetical protein